MVSPRLYLPSRSLGRLHRLIALLLWACTAASISRGEGDVDTPAIDPALPVLRSFQDIYSVVQENLSKPHAVSIEAQVLYFDPSAWNVGFFTDGSLVVGLPPLGSTLNLQMGDTVRLHGRVIPAQPLNLATFSVERATRQLPLLPDHVDSNLRELLRPDARFVRVRALVEQQEDTDLGHLELRMIVDGLKVRGRLLLHDFEPKPLLERQVVYLTGVLVPSRAPAPEFLADLWIGDTSAIELIGPLDQLTEFDMPLTPIDGIYNSPIGKPVRLEATVYTIAAGHDIGIEDAANPKAKVRVSTMQTLDVRERSRIEVVGVPVRTDRSWRIDRPLIRRSRLESAMAATTDSETIPAAEQTSTSSQAGPLPVIASFQQLWQIPESEREKPHQLAIEIHVSYCDPGWHILWAENGGAETFIAVKRTDFDLRTGNRALLSGVFYPKDGLAITDAIDVNVIRDGPLGAPVVVPFEPIVIDGNLKDPALDARTIRITGLVEKQDVPSLNDLGHPFLTMVVDGHRVIARIRLYDAERLPNLVGKIVTLDGVLVRDAGDADKFTGTVWAGRSSTVRIIANLDRDPTFDVRPIPSEQLAETSPDKIVRIQGTVDAIDPGSRITLSDETGSIVIASSQTFGIAVGTRVEARGFPLKSGAGWTLDRALLRPISVDGKTGAIGSTKIPVILQRAEQVSRLPRAEADRKVPVQLRGVVTWSHPSRRSFFMGDELGGVLVMLPDADSPHSLPAPNFGQEVTVKGHTIAGPFANAVQADAVTLGASGNLPTPREVAAEAARSGALEAARIRIEGYVRTIETVDGMTRLRIISRSGIDVQAVIAAEYTPSDLQGSLISVTGICQAVTTNLGTGTDTLIWVGSLYDLSVIESSPRDRFQLERTQIATLNDPNARRQTRAFVRIQGIVVARLMDHEYVLNDRSGSVVILTENPADLQPGDFVDATGLVGSRGPRTVLREVVYTIRDRNQTIEPVTLNSSPLLNVAHDGSVVTIIGEVVERTISAGKLHLGLSRDGEMVEVEFPDASRFPDKVQVCEPGARVSITGVYLIGYDDEHRPARISLYVRNGADIRLVDKATWLTAERARAMAGILAGVLAVAFAWAYALRRRVKHQTGQIRQQLVKEARLEDRQRNIIEKASDFIFMLDLSGNFTLFNPAGEAMTGYTREDVPRLTVYDLIDESDRIGLRTSLLKARPGSEIQPFQSQFRRKDGTQIWVEVAIRFLVEDDRVTGALCVARDITERKRVEEELKRARDAAEANTKAKSAFLANMSHEIRTPMNGVIGMSNLLLDTPLNHDQRDFALTIRNSAEALLTVLNDILDFSKIEAGKLQFETLDFDLTETVDDTLDLLAARAASKHLELAALIPTSLPQKLRGDPGRLRQVLLNLIGNAIKFTEKGDVSVGVSLERENRFGYLLRFEVRDTGIGMSHEEQQRLFMPFSQADASTTRKYGGTGLGLAICRQIVEQMNGQIGVRSEPGQGSTFWFTVEFARGSETPLDPQPGALRGQRVLGVDDNQVNRLVLQHYLEASGARLELAADAHEALGMLRAAATAGDPFRLILLDYHMPDMDGITLAREIGADVRMRGVTMALLTSVDRRFTAEELSAIGIAASMAKPIRQRELMQTIQRALSADTVAASKPASEEPTSTPMPTLRVLVAEDNPVNQRLTRIQLKKLGYEADLACNGLEVLEAFERVNYDVIFMDCQMPELDGYDTARRLATHPRRSEVRIVAMTANAMQGDRDKCLESGMDDYLSKPTRPDDLTAALRRAAEAIARPV